MRFLLILLTLALLPVMVGVHAWCFARHQQPELQAQALAILRQEGIRDATADLRYLDLTVKGDALDLQTVERATAALTGLRPTRLISNSLSIPSSLRADLREGTLRLEGWLPDQAGVDQVSAQLATLRPDLKIDVSALQTSTHVRSEGLSLQGILDKLLIEPALDITATPKGFKLAGALPSESVKASIVSVLQQAAPERPVDTSLLLISRHMLAAPFAQAGALEPFLRSFYGSPSAGNFSILLKEGARLQAAATAALETQWLSLLKPALGGMRVDPQLTRYPSIYHFPGYRPITPLPAETLETLRQSVSDFYLVFAPGSSSLQASAKARLAGLASTLLAAGPALHLVIGGHPDSEGRGLALARAEEVRSYLIEQGAPAIEIQVMAFDPVPVGTPGAPLQERSVELLIK